MPVKGARYLMTLAGLGALLLWAYWSSLAEVAQRWATDPQYAQGYLVPGLALAVLWARRRGCPALPWHGSWWAVPAAALAGALRLAGTYVFVEWVELVSLIPCLAACCLAVGGWPLLRWAGPSIGFVLFMMPLPFSVETAISGPLRRVSTLASAFLLQTLGFPAVAEQNIILVDEVQIGVVEACSGVGMIITLFALTTTAAYFCERPPWQKAVIVASTVPIAVFANVLRITLTGVLYELASSDAADLFYHDLAGWIMMPVALVLLWLEFKLLANLFVEVQIDSRLAYDFTGPAPAPHPQPQACVSQNPGS